MLVKVGYDPSGGIPVDPSSAGAVSRPPMMRGGMRGRGRGGQATGRFPQVSSNRGDGKTLQASFFMVSFIIKRTDISFLVYILF